MINYAIKLIDVITDIYASRVKKEAFKSRRIRKGLIEKIVIYNLPINTGINYEAFYMVLVSTIFICKYELSSMMETHL